MKIELHLLQNFVPSNLNRDDSGNPKDCEFGGFRRARVSSQCLKRRIRTSNAFRNRVSDLGKRTRRLAPEFEKKLSPLYPNPEEASFVAEQLLLSITKSVDKGLTDTLIFMGDNEIDQLVSLVAEEKESVDAAVLAQMKKSDEKAKKSASKETPIFKDIVKKWIKLPKRIISPDIALFGRMLASEPALNVDAACQVAHAISTNRLTMDFDYFTALDDLKTDGEQGAGMIGSVGFNSSCFYRYACIDADLLLRNLKNDKETTVNAIAGFIEGSIEAIPTGKINTFGNNNPPGFVLCTISNGSAPASLANAFELPASPKNNLSLTEESVRLLDEHFEAINSAYSREFHVKAAIHVGNGHANLKLKDSLLPDIGSLVKKIENFLQDNLN